MSDAEEALLFIDKAISIMEGWAFDEADEKVSYILELAGKIRKFAYPHWTPLPGPTSSSVLDNPHITKQRTDI